MKNKKFILFIIVIILNTSVTAIGKGNGGQAGTFLRNGVGSRALGMGNAYTSLVDDASAIYWNPAGLSDIPRSEFLGMFSILSLDRKQFFVSFANQFENVGTFGVGWLYFGVTDIDGRDAIGNHTEKFSDGENAFMFSYGRTFDFISVGITLKYLYHSLYNHYATGLGFDIGTIATIARTVKIGVVLQDVASSLKWTTHSNLKESVPIVLRVGASYFTSFLPMTITLEGKKVTNEDFITQAGLEYSIIDQFGVRCGYDGDNMSFGGFVKLSMKKLVTQVDYAATRDFLQNSYFHHITLRLAF